MEAGDYDQDYISRLTREAFPPDLSVLPLEYEDHQPPLYYLLATPVYWLSGGDVLSLRLFSLVLGGAGVAALFLLLREFRPTEPAIAWLGGGLVAFVPQFVAMMASVNNDALVLPLLWFWLWLALRYLRGAMPAWAIGVTAGALLLTKTTGYGVLPLAVLLVLMRVRRAGTSLSWAARQLAAILVPAGLLGGLWWLRNIGVYGWPDLLGLGRHNLVVLGQPLTADWIAQQGLGPFLRDAIWTLFRSFWGQFGWMGVVLDVRIYQGLAIFTSLTIYGAAWYLLDAMGRKSDARERDGWILLGASALITVVMVVGYNITFVQHQGRYLFPALPLFALAGALGWQRLAERQLAVGTALALAAMVAVLAGVGLLQGDLPLWPMAMLSAAALALFATRIHPAPVARRGRRRGAVGDGSCSICGVCSDLSCRCWRRQWDEKRREPCEGFRNLRKVECKHFGGFLSMLEPGLTAEIEHVVGPEDTAAAYGSGLVPVLSTPHLIALMESAAQAAIVPHLEAGQTAVGTVVTMKHLAATPVGMRVRVRAELVAVDGRRLRFHVEAWDDVEKVGEAEHERFVVDQARFMKRVAEKSGKGV